MADVPSVHVGYGCDRERLDPTDPQAEPGASDAWNAYLREIARSEREDAVSLSKTPDLPLALQSDTPIPTKTRPDNTYVIPSRSTSRLLDQLTSDETDSAQRTSLTLAQIAENARIHSLQAQAELQVVEDQFRRDWVACGFSLDSLKNKKKPPAAVDEKLLANQLEKIRLESSVWTGGSKKKKHGTTPVTQKKPETQGPDKDILQKLVYLAKKPYLPETGIKSEELIRQLEAPPKISYVPTPSQPEPVIEIPPPLNDVNEMLAKKMREQEEYEMTVRSIQAKIDALRNSKTAAEKFLDNVDELKAQKEREGEQRILKRHEEQRREKEEMARREAQELQRAKALKQKEEADRLAKEQQARKLKQQEAEQKAREELEKKRKQQEEAARKVKEAEDARQRAKAELEAMQAEQKRKQEEADLKAKQIAQHAQDQTQLKKEQDDQAQLKQVIDQFLSTMPYAASQYENVFAQYQAIRKDRLRLMNSISRLAPGGKVEPGSVHEKAYKAAVSFKYNMALIELRIKTVKGVYMNSDLTSFKAMLSKKIMQVNGEKKGYLQAANAVIKLLQALDQQVESEGQPRVILLDDFMESRTGALCSPSMFLSIYNCIKAILVKATAEGPEKLPVLKGLAMLLNAITADNGSFWKFPSLSRIILFRFYEQSPSLIGAMGDKQDIGYRSYDGQYMESVNDVNCRAEVMMIIYCMIGILRPSNIKRGQSVNIQHVYRCLDLNLNIPHYARDDVHYINIRTIMTIAPWSIRDFVQYNGVMQLVPRIGQYCQEEVNDKRRPLAALIHNQMDNLIKAGYTNPNLVYTCDDWKYWDAPEIQETYSKRAQIEPVVKEQMQADIATINARIERDQEKEEKFKVPVTD